MKYTFILFVLFLVSCSNDANKKNTIFVSILPQKFIAEQIAGSKYEVQVMVPPGFSAENYEPAPNKILDLSKAQVYFALGMPFEEVLLKKIKSINPSITIKNSSDGIKFRNLETPELVFEEHSRHHHEHNHSHKPGSEDIHTWLDPLYAKIHAENIFNILIKKMPENKPYFEKNLKSFNKRCDSITTYIKSIMDKKNSGILVFHPAFGYFTDRFNLRQIPIEFEGKEPAPGIINSIIKFGKEKNIQTIFLQEQFNSKAAEIIGNELNAKVLKIDPLSYDYFNNLVLIAQKISKGSYFHE